ncbi:MAG: hypothetical protein QM733_06505 [Ilumatobacteraceae bacterium]
MELGFITRAMRRFWWLILLCVVIFGLAGMLLRSKPGVSYRSTALIEIQEPSGIASSGDSGSSDRYLLGQLVTLQSTSFAAAVSQATGIGFAPTDVKVAQVTGTDVVRIDATAPSSETAHQLAGSYTSTYLSTISDQLKDISGPASDSLDAAIKTAETSLSDIDKQIADALQPYVEKAAANPSVNVPTIDQVNPQLATQRSILVNSYTQLLQQKSSLEINQPRVTSKVLQEATMPTTPVSEPLSLVAIAGPIGGILVGVVVAVGFARLSSRVLDAAEVSELIGVPIAGTLPRAGERAALAPTAPTVDPGDDRCGQRAVRARRGGRPADRLVLHRRRHRCAAVGGHHHPGCGDGQPIRHIRSGRPADRPRRREP